MKKESEINAQNFEKKHNGFSIILRDLDPIDFSMQDLSLNRDLTVSSKPNSQIETVQVQ